MKRYCKNIKFDKNRIMAAMLECLSDKWKRYDVARFLAAYQDMPARTAYRAIRENREEVKTFFGWFKNSDSDRFKKKYGIEQLMKYAKRRVRIGGRIHNRTASGQVAEA